jgi:O-antigen ligase
VRSPSLPITRVAAACRALGTAVFVVLCIREIIAELGSATNVVSPLVLALGAAAAGARFSAHVPLALAVAMPWLNGLTQLRLVPGSWPLMLVVSSMWLGRYARGAYTATQPSRLAEQRNSSWPAALVDLLVLPLVVSLGLQLHRHLASLELRFVFLQPPVVGYGDSRYFLNAAFIWLHGLLYARALLDCRPGLRLAIPVFLSLGAALATFVAIQYLAGIPEGWVGAGYQSPFEDLGSYGTMAVTVFAFFLGLSQWTSLSLATSHALLLAVLSVLVVASWSRASWLAGLVALVCSAGARTSRLAMLWLVVALFGMILAINFQRQAPFWNSNNYGIRLLSLVRIESLEHKDSGRFDLYTRGLNMIRSRPLLGHGIGSFYSDSVRYAPPHDLLNRRPEFAHNIFIQVAAEQGLPAMILLVVLLGLAFRNGWSAWRQASLPYSADCLAALGLTLGLAAYIQTCLTSNSLLIYAGHPLIFWFIAATLVRQPAG